MASQSVPEASAPVDPTPTGFLTFHMRAKSIDKLINTEFPNPLLKRNSQNKIHGAGKLPLDALDNSPHIFHTVCLSGTSEPGKSSNEFWAGLNYAERNNTGKYYISKDPTILEKFNAEFQKVGPFVKELYIDELAHFEFLRKNKESLLHGFTNVQKISYTKSRNPLDKEEQFPKRLVRFMQALPNPEKIGTIEIHGVSFTDRNVQVFPRILIERNPTIKELIYRCPEPEGFTITPETADGFMNRDPRITLLGSHGWNEMDENALGGVNSETSNMGGGWTFQNIKTYEPGEEKKHQGHPHFMLIDFSDKNGIQTFGKLVEHLGPTAKSLFYQSYGSPKEMKEMFKSQSWPELINLRLGFWGNDDFQWLKVNAPDLESFHLSMNFQALFPDAPTPIEKMEKFKSIFGGFGKLKDLHLQEQYMGGYIDKVIIQWLKSQYEKVSYSDIMTLTNAVANSNLQYV